MYQNGHTDSFQVNTNLGDMKYSILIVDDEFSGRTTLKILLEKHFWAHINTITFAKTFEEAKENIQESNFDLIFLDINLKGITAFELLPFIGNSTSVVFVTAYSEYMIQALRNKAFDYLVKPVKEEELRDCLLRFQKSTKIELKDEYIHIKQRGLTRILKTAEIIYVEGDGPYSTIHLKDDSCTTARTLKSLIPELGDNFVRIHKTYVVNRSYIKGFVNNKITLINDQTLPISRTGIKNI
jgi:two-component system LytT family response regulator